MSTIPNPISQANNRLQLQHAKQFQEFNEQLDRVSKSAENSRQWELLGLLSLATVLSAAGSIVLANAAADEFLALCLKGNGLVGTAWAMGTGYNLAAMVYVIEEMASGRGATEKPTEVFSLGGPFAIQFGALGGLVGGAQGEDQGIYWGSVLDVTSALGMSALSAPDLNHPFLDISNRVVMDSMNLGSIDSPPSTSGSSHTPPEKVTSENVTAVGGPSGGQSHLTISSASIQVVPEVSVPAVVIPPAEAYGHSAPTYGVFHSSNAQPPHDLRTLERTLFSPPDHYIFGDLTQSPGVTPYDRSLKPSITNPPSPQTAPLTSDTRLLPHETERSNTNQSTPLQNKTPLESPHMSSVPPITQLSPPPQSPPPVPSLTHSSSATNQNMLGPNLPDFLGGTEPSKEEVNSDDDSSGGIEMVLP
jgi:hypothetical protein